MHQSPQFRGQPNDTIDNAIGKESRTALYKALFTLPLKSDYASESTVGLALTGGPLFARFGYPIRRGSSGPSRRPIGSYGECWTLCCRSRYVPRCNSMGQHAHMQHAPRHTWLRASCAHNLVDEHCCEVGHRGCDTTDAGHLQARCPPDPCTKLVGVSK